MDGVQSQPAGTSKTVDLQTLVAAIQNAVQAQNGIATNIKALTTAFNTFNTNFLSALPVPKTGSATWSPGLIATGASASTTITVTGALVGNYVQVAYGATLQGCTLSGYVSAANTVTAVITNNTGGNITPAASTTVTAAVTTSGV